MTDLQKSSFFTRLRQMAVLLTIACLIVSNVLSISSERFHNRAFNFLQYLSSFAGYPPTSSVWNNSPVVKRAIDIKVATQLAKSEMQLLSQSHAALQVKIADLHKQAATLVNEQTALKTQANNRAAIVKKVTSKMTANIVANNARQLSSLTMRATPYFGVAASVLVTTWDIKTDCELMQAIDELTGSHNLQGSIEASKICGLKIDSPDKIWTVIKNRANNGLPAVYQMLEKINSPLSLLQIPMTN